jgi:hypothetical protein
MKILFLYNLFPFDQNGSKGREGGESFIYFSPRGGFQTKFVEGEF